MRGKKDVLFSSHNIYSALLQRIEHCSTRKSTCRLPIYIYIYMHELLHWGGGVVVTTSNCATDKRAFITSTL